MQPNTTSEYQLGITPSDVKWYALGRGWKSQPSKNPAIAIFVKPESNLQIQVPQLGTGRDMALMMAEVLRKLSEIENRQIEDVSQDLRHPFADALRLRVKSRLADAGTLPLLEGLQLFEGGRKLLVSAACSAVMPQAFYPRKSLKGVDEFIKKCQFGQTAIGSYVASIFCPPLAPAVPTLFDDLEETPPFERKVTQSLMNGLRVLNDSVQSGDPSLILNGIDQGVSADLCDALSSITPPEEDSVLQVEMSWSPVRPQTSSVISSALRFAAPDLAFIQSAGKKLREQTVRTDTIEGRIITLKEQAMLLKDTGRSVEIRARIDDRVSTVRFELKEDQYKKACDAYRDKRAVKVTGLLRRGEQSKFYDMDELTQFEILP
jgi:hypothetical protein